MKCGEIRMRRLVASESRRIQATCNEAITGCEMLDGSARLQGQHLRSNVAGCLSFAKLDVGIAVVLNQRLISYSLFVTLLRCMKMSALDSYCARCVIFLQCASHCLHV